MLKLRRNIHCLSRCVTTRPFYHILPICRGCHKQSETSSDPSFNPLAPTHGGGLGDWGTPPKPSAKGLRPSAHPLLHGAAGGTGEAKLAREPNSPTDNPVTLAFTHNRRLRLTWVATVTPLAFRRHPICDVYLEAGVILRPQLWFALTRPQTPCIIIDDISSRYIAVNAQAEV